MTNSSLSHFFIFQCTRVTSVHTPFDEHIMKMKRYYRIMKINGSSQLKKKVSEAVACLNKID